MYLSVFSPNVGKYGPEKTQYLDTFQNQTNVLIIVLNGFEAKNKLGGHTYILFP